MIEVAVRHVRGAFALEAAFAAEGRVTALFGRSGSGKSTLVDVIAGLVRPDRGRVVVDGVALLDTENGVIVPVHRRRIGYVFQDARLLPHFSVRQNLLFGRWFSRDRTGGPSLEAVADLLGIAPLLARRPAGLSGGERQRVAIGRALLARPRLLLMDEPLSALDEARKAEILPYVARLRDEARVPIVYVSHALAEVARLADTVVVLDHGKVAACGPAAEILSRGALFPGRDTGETGALLQMRIAAHDDAFGLTRLDGPPGCLTVPHLPLPVGASVRVRVRARDVMVAREAPRALSARNVLSGTVTAVTPGDGPHARVEIACGGASLVAEVTRLAVHDLALVPGLPVVAIVKSVAFDEETIGAVEI